MSNPFFREQQVTFYPSSAHFMLVAPKNRDEAVTYLKEHGILVRPMTAPAIQHTFRMGVGSPQAAEQLIQAYTNYLEIQ